MNITWSNYVEKGDGCKLQILSTKQEGRYLGLGEDKTTKR